MAKKSLGQHFLSDPSILNRIAAALPSQPGDPVLEIGPGRGALTQALLARGLTVTAIERDPDLIADLTSRFPTARIVEGDALALDWATTLGVSPGAPWDVVGNIPYNITSPLLDRALSPPVPRVAVFLMQREVAVRLTASPGSKEYGALTVGVGSAASVERLFSVPAGAFRPPPKVASMLVRLWPQPSPGVANGPDFRRFVTGLFGGRRKQLVRALRIVLDQAQAETEALVRRVGLDQSQRPETLTISEFERLFRAVVDEGRWSRVTL